MGDLLAGRYRLDQRIAVGGVGEVWRCTDTALARAVAVKLLRAEYAGHAEALARFQAEARHAGSLSHPAVARVYDYGEAVDACPPYLVMELVDGPSLAEVLRRGPLGPAHTMQVVAQAAAGLAAAHEAGLVHRDIKPANLLLSRNGQAKITDFGIAHAAGSVPLTRTGVLVGTPAYLAPERVAGASGTPASDLYALGIVAYECLAGRSPFDGKPLDVAAAHRERPIPRLPATVPAAVAALVTDLTAKDPAARPEDARVVARRAARLREALAAAAATTVGTRPAGVQPGRARRRLRFIVAAGHQHWADRYGPGRTWPVRSVALAVTTAAVTAGLAGWLLGGAFGAAQPSAGRPAAHSASGRPGGTVPAPRAAGGDSQASGAADSAVRVSRASLVGMPVTSVRQHLRRLGLQVRVHWRDQGEHPPGTVLATRPGGPLYVNSIVVVTATRPPLPPLRADRPGGGEAPGSAGR